MRVASKIRGKKFIEVSDMIELFKLASFSCSSVSTVNPIISFDRGNAYQSVFPSAISLVMHHPILDSSPALGIGKSHVHIPIVYSLGSKAMLTEFRTGYTFRLYTTYI